MNFFFLILILHDIKSANLSQLQKQKFRILSFWIDLTSQKKML